jgi:hypothetical protein
VTIFSALRPCTGILKISLQIINLALRDLFSEFGLTHRI